METLKLNELSEINGGGNTIRKIGKGIGRAAGTAWRYTKNFGKTIPGPIPPFFIVPRGYPYNGGPV